MLTGVRTVANCWSVHSISWSHSTFDCYCYTMIWFTQMLYLHIPSDEASRDGACVLDYKCPSCRFGFAFAFLLFLFKSAIVILFPSSLVCSFYISLDNQSDQVRRLNASLIFFFLAWSSSPVSLYEVQSSTSTRYFPSKLRLKWKMEVKCSRARVTTGINLLRHFSHPHSL